YSRCTIAPHGIHGNLDHFEYKVARLTDSWENELIKTSQSLRRVRRSFGLFFGYFKNLTLFVETAMRTSAVGHAQFVAIRAFRKGLNGKMVMRATPVSSSLGMSSFGI